jgi:predicted lipoprotein with Yx(FWY)xxD motif
MRTRRAILVIGALLALAGCGGEEERPAARAEPSEPTPAATATPTPTAAEQEEAGKPAGTKLTVAESEFGSMLFDSRKQAIYIFERDSKDETVCYGDCAEAWPPVYTDGEPVAGKGVRAALLGTVKRRDGRLQVTYAGKPLYFYAHEGPGQVLCHNVNLNGGFWWVVAPNGERRA